MTPGLPVTGPDVMPGRQIPPHSGPTGRLEV